MRIHLLEIKYEFLKAIRMPAYALPTICFPLLFYVFFGLVFGRQQAGGVQMASYLIATYGCFGVIAVARRGASSSASNRYGSAPGVSAGLAIPFRPPGVLTLGRDC